MADRKRKGSDKEGNEEEEKKRKLEKDTKSEDAGTDADVESDDDDTVSMTSSIERAIERRHAAVAELRQVRQVLERLNVDFLEVDPPCTSSGSTTEIEDFLYEDYSWLDKVP